MRKERPAKRYVWIALVMLASATVFGCSRSGLDLVPVEGVVKFKGAPVAGAGIMFVPARGLPAMAITDENGKFELKTANQSGALVGEYQVSISKSKTTTIPQNQGFPLYKTESLIPNKYTKSSTSGLTANVVDDDNNFEFDLTEK